MAKQGDKVYFVFGDICDTSDNRSSTTAYELSPEDAKKVKELVDDYDRKIKTGVESEYRLGLEKEYAPKIFGILNKAPRSTLITPSSEVGKLQNQVLSGTKFKTLTAVNKAFAALKKKE